MKNNYSIENKFNGIYRGYVVDNEDPKNKGRIKVFVPGVYSNEFKDKIKNLPWALPAMPIYGGGATNKNITGVLNKEVGWTSVPHKGNINTGSQVFVFFENGDINYPVYFAVSQSGEGWLSEHPDQHVFNSDNVRIRIDESVYNEDVKKWETDEKSTCKHDSYTENIHKLGKEQLEIDCEDNKWEFSNGQVKQLETRIDIEIKADNINAVNLNIHGNVNMHIDGNWYVDHIGNKYEYHKGEHYIKHEGNTYIEHNGIYHNDQKGDRIYFQEGMYFYDQSGHATIHRTDALFEKIEGYVEKEYDKRYNLTIGGKTEEIYNDDRKITVKGNYIKEITKNKDETITGNSELKINGALRSEVSETISFTSKKGNFIVKTEGLFDLFDKNGNITSDGFNNLGNKGNIQFISTFGNINIQCIKDEKISKFSNKSVVIPWNPGFLAEIKKNIVMYPTFSKEDATSKGLNFPTDIFDFSGFLSFFKSLPNLLIYDGLPVFLPTKMIIQNPNIPSPKNTNDLSWIPNFRSEVTDWRSGNNSMYWKLPGRMMGNINIETWSGDINIKTESEIGCAGNINISACEKTGTLPGYKIGCVNIKNSAKRRIYPDPRDLFFDSDFQKRNSGQLVLFSHGTNVVDAIKKQNMLLPKAVSTSIQQIGLSLNLFATDYNDFYKLNALAVATKGNLNVSAPLNIIDKLKNKPAPKLGCLKCISDFFLGFPGIQETCYVTENLNDFSTVGIHRYSFSKFNPYDTINPRGVFNILSLNYDKISMGDGHAIESGFTDRVLGGKNIGSFNLVSDTDININSGKNYYLNSNTSMPDAERSVSHVVTEKAWDDFPPTILTNGINGLNKIWSNTGGLVFEIDSGEIKILKFLGDLLSIDTGIKILNILPKLEYISMGYVNKLTEKIGKNIIYTDEDVKTYDLDLGFNIENLKDLLLKNDFSKLKAVFTNNEYVIKSYNGSYKLTNKSGSFAQFGISEFSQDITLFINLNKDFHEYLWNDNNGKYSNTHNFNDQFSLTWNFKESAPNNYFPSWEFKNEFINNYKLGNGITKTESIIDYSKYGYHDKIDLIKNITDPIPGEAYIDINRNENYITSKSNSFWSSWLMGESRNINETITGKTGNDIIQKINYNSNRSTSKFVTYASPINKNIFTLHSDNIWEDVEQERIYSTNEMKTIIKGIHTPSKYDDEEDWDREESNNYEFNVDGFPLNNIVLKNGITTFNSTNNLYVENGSNVDGSISGLCNNIAIKNGTNIPSSTNSFSFENGGNADFDNNYFSILNGINSINTTNNFDLVNGIIDLENTKFSTISNNLNNLTINNGSGTNTTNVYTINNGLNTKDSSNLYSINNGTWQPKAGDSPGLINKISINNTNHYQEILLDGSVVEDKQKQINLVGGDIKVYACNNIIENAGTSYTLNTLLQTENTTTKIFNNQTNFTVNTLNKVLNVDVNNINVSNSMSTMAAKSITLNAPAVNVSKIISMGDHTGDFHGAFEGTGGPVEGGLIWGVVPNTKLVLTHPAAPTVNVPPAELTEPVPTMVNAGFIQPILSSIGKLIGKFMKFELSFFEKYF